ncbi:hypothetical protein BVX95_00725 [archaeon D22]|nr:hypothetical protein BVX95_00725 [archaeon D22]
MKDIFENKTILVTGGCGSIGSEIVHQLLQYNPKTIRVLDNNESGHFHLEQKIGKSEKMRYLVGDIKDRDRVFRAMEGVDVVFHAAALKHVPLCEYNPFEAVSTNVIGTQNLVEASMQHRVDKFIGISTDKAVNPVNTMGATKLLSEKIITCTPIGLSHVKFCCVRFGNVLDSVGSVIPIFKEQIKNGGPVTITSPKMTRFFMSMPDAVNLVLKSAKIVRGGETFILKMQTLKIIDLADAMIELLAPKHNFKIEDIKKDIMGIRHGEKFDESLMSSEEAPHSEETEDMIILKNSLLAHATYEFDEPNNEKEALDYNSSTLKHLNKDEIKHLLLEKKII